MKVLSKMALLVALLFAFCAIVVSPTNDALARKKKKRRKKKGYSGVKKCDGSCHDEWIGAWLKTSHARTYTLLKPGERADARKKAEASIKEKLVKVGGRDQAYVDGLDVVNADFTKEPLCLRCHTTGYGQKKGFDPNNKKHKYIDDMPTLASAGCEMCHSLAGGAAMRKKMKKTKGKFKLKDMEKYGYVFPRGASASVCNRCHEHPNSPFQASVDAKYKFNFDERKDPSKKGVHKHFKMEYDHDDGSPKKFIPEQWHIEGGKVVFDSKAKLE